MNALARMFEERSPGERRVIVAIGAAIVLVLAVTFTWLPIERSRARLRAELPALRASIATLEREADEARRLRALPVMSRSATEPGTAATRPLPGAQVSLVDARTFTVSGADVAFGALLEWLAAAQSTQGLRVESARIEALPAPGRVRAELRLSRT
jgi:general secretion pathway protein M